MLLLHSIDDLSDQGVELRPLRLDKPSGVRTHGVVQGLDALLPVPGQQRRRPTLLRARLVAWLRERDTGSMRDTRSSSSFTASSSV